MLSTEALIDEKQDSYSHLFFIFSILSQKVLFASLPMESFFEITIDWQQNFPFAGNVTSFSDSDQPAKKQDLEKKWQNCLLLAENKTENFSFITATKDNRQVIYRFDALGAPALFNLNEPAIICSVKKSVINPRFLQAGKNRDKYRKDYAEFIDIASHDLDAPLRKITLLIDRLAQKTQSPPGEVQGYFDRIQTSLLEMRALVDNLNAWAGISAAEAVNTECNLDEVATQILPDIQAKHPGKTIKANLDHLPLVIGNKREYEQLFYHLFKNAVCYSRENEDVKIHVTSQDLTPADAETYQLDPARHYSRIVVRDEGLGFSQDFAEKIFRPFTRLHGKSEYPGTGMGLAISKKIVEKYGGIMYAESEENKGATFTLILPQSL